MSAEFCSNIEQHTQDPIYGDVEKEVNINNRYTFKLYYRYYYFVLGTSLVLFIFACILGLARLWGFKEKINTTDISLKGLFSLILV